jgi:hypothetical protein
VEDRVRASRSDNLARARGVEKVAIVEGDLDGDGRSVTTPEVVEHLDFVSSSQESLDRDATDVSGSAGDEDAHHPSAVTKRET